jgi:hypothetical protein
MISQFLIDQFTILKKNNDIIFLNSNFLMYVVNISMGTCGIKSISTTKRDKACKAKDIEIRYKRR